MFKFLAVQKLVWKTNWALEQVSISSRKLGSEFRLNLRNFAFIADLTPEELAAFLVYEEPSLVRNHFEAQAMLSKWRFEGKIRPVHLTNAKFEWARISTTL